MRTVRLFVITLEFDDKVISVQWKCLQRLKIKLRLLTKLSVFDDINKVSFYDKKWLKQ